MKEKNSVIVITKEHDPWTIKAIYGGLDYLVGTRFHSVIFAVTSHVPSIAIEYEHKTRGIMRDIGLEEWVLNINDLHTDQLIELFEKLVTGRKKYVAHLKRALPPYIVKAKEAIGFVKYIYENNNS